MVLHSFSHARTHFLSLLLTQSLFYNLQVIGDQVIREQLLQKLLMTSNLPLPYVLLEQILVH